MASQGAYIGMEKESAHQLVELIHHVNHHNSKADTTNLGLLEERICEAFGFEDDSFKYDITYKVQYDSEQLDQSISHLQASTVEFNING